MTGRYSADTVEPGAQCMISLLGDHSMRLGIISGQFAVSTTPGEEVSGSAFTRNIEDLRDIYSRVNMVKTAIAGMDDITKLAKQIFSDTARHI